MVIETPANFGIAVYAAVVATVAVIWNIIKARRRVIIKMKHAYKIYEGVKEVEYQIAVDVINKGEQDIKLVNLGFELPDKRILLPNQEFLGLPRRVGTGDSTTFLLESEHIKNIKEKEKECGANIKFVYVTDSIDNRFRAEVPKSIKRAICR
jgi:hypothetical protein